MKEIDFYILVPVYKVEKYIRACIDSVLSQTYTRYQLILVDDGSPDKSGAICDEYAILDKRIRVIHQEHLGLYTALEAAAGYVLEQPGFKDSYVVYLDSDDELRPDALEAISRAVRAYDADMIVYGMDRVFEGKVRKRYNANTSFAGVITDKRALYRLVFRDWSYNPLWRKAISSSLLSAADYHKEHRHVQRGVDLLLSLPYYQRCRKAAFIHESVYLYTLNPDSITQSISFERFRVDPTVRKAVWDFLQKQNVWNQRDFYEYFKYLKSTLARKILTIAGFKTSKHNIKQLFDKVRNDEYYAMVLNSEAHGNAVLWLLKKRMYECILLYAAGRRKLIKLYKDAEMRLRSEN